MELKQEQNENKEIDLFKIFYSVLDYFGRVLIKFKNWLKLFIKRYFFIYLVVFILTIAYSLYDYYNDSPIYTLSANVHLKKNIAKPLERLVASINRKIEMGDIEKLSEIFEIENEKIKKIIEIKLEIPKEGEISEILNFEKNIFLREKQIGLLNERYNDDFIIVLIKINVNSLDINSNDAEKIIKNSIVRSPFFIKSNEVFKNNIKFTIESIKQDKKNLTDLLISASSGDGKLKVRNSDLEINLGKGNATAELLNTFSNLNKDILNYSNQLEINYIDFISNFNNPTEESREDTLIKSTINYLIKNIIIFTILFLVIEFSIISYRFYKN